MLQVDFLLPRPGELPNLPHLWLRTGGVGRNGKGFERIVNGSLMALKEAAGEGLKESEENIFRVTGKGIFII